jgi:hypothetical protein
VNRNVKGLKDRVNVGTWGCAGRERIILLRNVVVVRTFLGSGARSQKAPNPKLQAPKKLQIPSSKGRPDSEATLDV